ncbi:MAG: AraC family transcriptional regulator, partial [Sphingobacteriaceae bacterium]
MKPHLLKVDHGPAQSFSVRQDFVPYINNRWHYHTEVELIHFEKGNGTQFIGDSIKQFAAGDVVLLGANLPHYWRFDDAYFAEGTTEVADIRVAHFNENFWGNTFLQLPENKNIRALLEKAKRGVQITGTTRHEVATILQQMVKKEGIERIILLMKVLNIIAQSDDISLISSIGFSPSFEETEKDRINAIYEYSIANFKNKIPLEEIAAIAGISTHSFCRYFKS